MFEEENKEFLSKSHVDAADRFFAEQKAKWPTLYNHWDSLVYNYIFTDTDAVWNGDGILTTTDKKWDADKKEFVEYPFRMSLDDAWHSTKGNDTVIYFLSQSYGRCPIDNMPNNIDRSFLGEAEDFLKKYDNITVDEYENILRINNPIKQTPDIYINMYVNGFKEFKKKIKNWLAIIENIEYVKRHGVFDPETIMGMYI